MIRIVDYGVGNIQAFMNMFKRLDIPAERAKRAGELGDATHLILPGVGAFDHAMQLLNESGMRPVLEELVLVKQLPVLGVCVGMQMLATGSDEGEMPGLNWIPGRVRSFASRPEAAKMPMPHMGWNDLAVRDDAALFQRGFDAHPQFYFLHSYYFDARDKSDVAATANYGFDFDAIVSRGHIHGVQCHPEKSHHWGGQLLKNFAES
ncbi:imidazole glycerol phosphate synthase, glutamine amidotransferase subunit [Pandoraea pnomenusa]|jgi:glutamine amidotransferase|uniref:Imidazole glycerol phosphate synthase subunit HisH n=1 Tax=Pandoraea pnomenusa TaxID=93220 RepID=A0ABY6WQ28_9BURK|nr:imidazole glycerol phosphate synthase subunit HisH [Pandoraea pnomenusa]AHN76014.1 imidazole glycerol phosphate synthase, glutamine amidotransferase subunit [Pandoraea pnomenusa]ANC44548.1 imidazole glycerol phosphate synthase, glutamine amidotransferase subunit [Pandoraea pnomenusa]QDH61799.1 imidazole glycerol phosphate synthase subunit HisH [Pandoraea pnomenusa]VVE71239.1 imidazole glycerol phosphate synthase, glutamine amidotransferase subunit [Pandoraea pnomenusa]